MAIEPNRFERFINQASSFAGGHDYTFQADVINSGPDAFNVTADLISMSPYTEVVDGSLGFGDVLSGDSLQSSDTFTIRQNRRYPFDPDALEWIIQYASTIVIFGKAVAGLPVVCTINIRDSSEPAKTSFSAINTDGSYTLDIDLEWQPPFLLWADS